MQAIDKINFYISLFMTLEENPERILTEVYTDNPDNFLTRIIESSKELTDELIEVHDLQDDLYRILIPYLQEIIDGKEFIYDKNSYPSPIHIFDNNREIGRLNIFEHTYTVIPHEDYQQEELKLAKLEEENKQNVSDIEKFEGYQTDLLSYGDTAFKKMKIMLRRKHYKNKIKSKYKSLLELSLDLEQALISQRLLLERVQQGLKPYEDMQYEIANIFGNKYGYQIIREDAY